jgi:hypothetical protein
LSLGHIQPSLKHVPKAALQGLDAPAAEPGKGCRTKENLPNEPNSPFVFNTRLEKQTQFPKQTQFSSQPAARKRPAP